ncbi:hypothetical protein [Polaromonas sp.]|uniref:hypothetical protein n=1 Tax=Polaromonas sp. TaxID=1869339 RepID=UPI0037532CDC
MAAVYAFDTCITKWCLSVFDWIPFRAKTRTHGSAKVLDELERNMICAEFHDVPLRAAPAGLRYGRVHGALTVTDEKSASRIRLPLWIGITQEQQSFIAATLRSAIDLTQNS